jgi:hypothetical protein
VDQEIAYPFFLVFPYPLVDQVITYLFFSVTWLKIFLASSICNIQIEEGSDTTTNADPKTCRSESA